MSEVELKAYVTVADGDTVRVRVLDATLEADLLKLGFVYDPEFSEYTRKITSDQDKGALFSKLRELRIPFSAGREWCPSEVFEYLREQGIVTGDYQRVSWIGQGKYHLTTE